MIGTINNKLAIFNVEHILEVKHCIRNSDINDTVAEKLEKIVTRCYGVNCNANRANEKGELHI